MRDYEVLLRETVKDLGIVGDVVRVRPGFARNFLFPRRLAVEATEENKKEVARKRQVYEAQMKEVMADVERRVEAMGQLTLTTREKADESGHLYGSVGAAKIVELLAAMGVELPEDAVRLDRPIKTTGTHQIPVHVHGDRTAEVTLSVEPEEAPAS